MRNLLKITASALALTFAAGALVNSAQAAYNMRVYSSLPANDQSSHYVWFKSFEEKLKQKVGDEVKLHFFANGMLGKEADACQQVKMGAIQVMISGTSIWSTLVPEIGVLDLGYLFKDFDTVGKALDGDAGQKLGGMLEKNANVKILGFGYNLGARNVYTKKEIKTPEDLQNVKIRVLPVPTFLATFEAMGAVPIPMPGGEVYSGLQMGVIDGVEHDAPTVLSSKYYEQAKFGYLTHHVFNPIVAVMNKNILSTMPEEIQKAIDESAREATIYERTVAVDSEAKAIEELKAKGVKFTVCPDGTFDEAVKKVKDDFITQYPETKDILTYIEGLK